MHVVTPLLYCCITAAAAVVYFSSTLLIVVNDRMLGAIGMESSEFYAPLQPAVGYGPEASSSVGTGGSTPLGVPPPRMLLGIFTTNSEKEATRRKLIRRTYLSQYNLLADANLGNETAGRLCPLSDLLEEQTNKKSPTTSSSKDECLIAYTFVMAAFDQSNVTAPTDLTIDEEGHSGAFVVDRSGGRDFERDVTYLNIRENMNEGKTATWFKYASSIIPADLGIDLIAKVDSDAIVVPRALLEDANSWFGAHHIQRPVRNVYGGIDTVQRDEGDIPYMQGGFYLLSTDVAEAIFSSNRGCPRDELVQQTRAEQGWDRAEDREVGYFIEKCWNGPRREKGGLDAIRQWLVNGQLVAGHGRFLKNAADFRVQWKHKLSTDIALLRHREIQTKYISTNGCPPSQVEAEEELGWFDNRENMQQSKEKFARSLRKACTHIN